MLLLDSESGLSCEFMLCLSLDDFRSATLSSAPAAGIGDGEADGWATDSDERERPKPDIILNAAGGFEGSDWPELGVDEVRSAFGREAAVTNETSEGTTVDVFADGQDAFAPSWED